MTEEDPPDNVVTLRPCVLEFEFTEEEMALIRAKAALLGLSIEAYMRKALFEDMPGDVP